MSERPDWDNYFLKIATAVAERGDCRRRLVGAVLVDEHHKIIGTGYNGVASGVRGCLDGACPRGLLSYDKVAEFTDYNNPDAPGYCISTHAELNAMLHAGRSCLNSTMYITDAPCRGCEKAMLNAGLLNWKYKTKGGTIINMTNGPLL